MMTSQVRRRSTPSEVSQTPRNWLSEIRTDSKPRPTAAVLYGPPGIGKTSVGAAMPDCVFLIDNQEDGIFTLKSSGQVKHDVAVLPAAADWESVLGMLENLRTGEHAYKSLVVDTIGGIERLCHQHVVDTQFNGEWGDKGFTSYHKGYEVSLPVFREFLNAIDRLRTERSMGILLLAHSIVKPYKNPIGDDYDQFKPDVHAKTWGLIHKWSDMVLFANYEVEVVTEGTRKKGRGGQYRTMHTVYHAAYEAKNRFSLPDEIEMGENGEMAWANLRNAMKEVRK